MKKYLRSYKFWLIIFAILAVTGSIYTYHMVNRYKVLDRAVFNDFRDRVHSVSESGGFESREQLSSFVTDWADENSLEYKLDSAGNIIFDTPAIERKKNVTPTLVIVNVNYLTAADNPDLFASAASIAAADLSSGRKTVVFANNENEADTGIKSLSKKLIGKKSKVIYMDYGSKAYVSVYSYAKSIAEIKIPAKTEKPSQDSAIKIHIGGINKSAVGPDISKQANPIAELGKLLTRLKSRSVDFRVADIEVESFENMYPVSLDVTIALNSYALPAYTKYINQQIKNFTKEHEDTNPEIEYAYEVLEEDALPKTCYDAKTSDLMARLLYTINSGAYKFTKNDPVPDSKIIGDVSGINCMMDIEKKSEAIVLRMLSQGYDDTYLNRIVTDNHASAELNECTQNEIERIAVFNNDKNSLLRTFRNTYSKVYDASDNAELTVKDDDRFTPCSYLQDKNKNADIIHLRLSNKSAVKLTNTLMCYIKSKGNTFSL